MLNDNCPGCDGEKTLFEASGGDIFCSSCGYTTTAKKHENPTGGQMAKKNTKRRPSYSHILKGYLQSPPGSEDEE